MRNNLKLDTPLSLCQISTAEMAERTLLMGIRTVLLDGGPQGPYSFHIDQKIEQGQKTFGDLCFKHDQRWWVADLSAVIISFDALPCSVHITISVKEGVVEIMELEATCWNGAVQTKALSALNAISRLATQIVSHYSQLSFRVEMTQTCEFKQESLPS